MTSIAEYFSDPAVNMRVALLDRVVTTGNGEWFETAGYDKFTIEVVKDSGATLSAQLYVSNQPAPLPDGGVAYGTAVTASAIIEVHRPFRWMRLAPTLSGGAVSAYLEAV